MPSRRFCLLIIVFWLACNGLLFYDNLLPWFLPGQPPAYTIDLVEEAQTRRPHINWLVYHNDQKVMRARTIVTHPEHDVFEMTAEYFTLANIGEVPISGFLVKDMSSKIRVNSAGNLLGMEIRVQATPRLNELFRVLSTPFTLEIKGDVDDGRFAPTATLEMAGQQSRSLKFPAATLSRGQSVLQPLHPVNRIRGLVPGQRWHQTVFDPLQDSCNALLGMRHEPEVLQARVLPQPEEFTYGRRQTQCLVIEYKGDDMTGRTYVEENRGLVLCQEVKLRHESWVMYRD